MPELQYTYTVNISSWSRIHERQISLRFLEIILRVSQTWSFCLDFLNHRGGGMVFFIRFSSFLPYSVQ